MIIGDEAGSSSSRGLCDLGDFEPSFQQHGILKLRFAKTQKRRELGLLLVLVCHRSEGPWSLRCERSTSERDFLGRRWRSVQIGMDVSARETAVPTFVLCA